MIPTLRKFWHDFLYSPERFTLWSRSALMALAGSGLAFASDLAGLGASPTVVQRVKVASVVAAFLASALKAGDKNPPAAP
jgi:hypothetical protein